MSVPTDTAQLVIIYASIQGDNYLGWVPIALLAYDYFLMLDLEFELFWKRKLTSASVLFILIRYITIARVLLSILGYISIWTDPRYNTSTKCCNRLVKTAAVVEYMQYIPWAAFSALRGYALTKSRMVAAAIFTLSIAPVGVNIAQFVSGISGAAWPLIGCLADYANTPQELIIFPIVSRGGLIIADFILVVVTLRSLGTAEIRKVLKKTSRGSISAVMLRNGLVYFVVLFVMNAVHLTLWLTAVLGNPVSFMTEFTDPLTTILTTRFFLDLQEADRHDMKLRSDDPLHFSGSFGALSFARAMGPIGDVDLPDVMRKEEDMTSESDRSASDTHIDVFEWDIRLDSRPAGRP